MSRYSYDMFWPAEKACWIDDAKPDRVIVPSNNRWTTQDHLRVKHRYDDICPVYYKAQHGGSGDIFGVVSQYRINAMHSFDVFWQEVTGERLQPRQLAFEVE